MVLTFGVLGGLFLMWAYKQSLRPTSLMRIPRAYTDILRSQPKGASASTLRSAPAAAAPAAAAAAGGKRKTSAVVEDEVEEAEVPAAKKASKPSRRSGSAKKKAPVVVEVEEEEEEEEEEEVEEKAAPVVEAVKPKAKPAAAAPQKKAAAAAVPAPAAASAPQPAEKKKKISRRSLGKEKGQEPNPAGFVDPKTGKLPVPGSGSAGVAIPPPPAPVEEAMPRKTIVPAPPRAPLKKLFKSEADIPEFCEGPERFPEEPVEWHIVEEEEVDREAHPCHLANVTHWALKYWYKLGQIKICTHDPLVDEVRGRAAFACSAHTNSRTLSLSHTHTRTCTPPPPGHL
jgi:hypothetical protein